MTLGGAEMVQRVGRGLFDDVAELGRGVTVLEAGARGESGGYARAEVLGGR